MCAHLNTSLGFPEMPAVFKKMSSSEVDLLRSKRFVSSDDLMI